MQKQSVLTVFLIGSLTACDLVTAPPCQFEGEPLYAPSAGCLSVVNQTVLVVEGMNGTIGLPGGSSSASEPSQCTAYRETWEETGLLLEPAEHLTTLDTGFHVFRCERNAQSGEINPPPRFEIRQAFYLPLDQFEQWQWRFPGQDQIVRELSQSRSLQGKGK